MTPHTEGTSISEVTLFSENLVTDPRVVDFSQTKPKSPSGD